MRKLPWAAAGYLAAAAVSHYLLPSRWLPYCACICAILAALCLISKLGLRRAAAAGLLFAAAAFIWTWGHEKLFIEPAQALTGTEMRVSARVLDYPVHGSSYARIKLLLTDRELPAVKLYAYDYSGSTDHLIPGDEISVSLKFKTALEMYGQESDTYISNGIFLRASVKGQPVNTGRWPLSFIYLPGKLARLLSDETALCFPADTSAFMQALLTGDRQEIYSDTAAYSGLQAAGLSHVVAISGMHVSYLVSMLGLISGKKRRTALLGIPAVIAFMAMTGFSPSVTRAGIMQIIMLLAPLLRRENDALSALSAALIIVLLPNPHAVGSVSFQLSFAAMLGLVLFTPGICSWLLNAFSIRRAVFRWAAQNLSCTIGSLCFTLPLSALHFGCVPIYSAISNLLCLWAVSLCFILGYLCCLAGFIWLPLGKAAAWLTAWLPRYILWVCRVISRAPGALAYTDNVYVRWWLFLVYAVFLLAWLLRSRDGFRPVIPACACAVSLAFISLLSTNTVPEGVLTVTAVDVGQGQSIVALQQNSSVVIDCGGINSAGNAGEKTAAFLAENGRDSVELLILTHLHADHVNGVERLMSLVKVKSIFLSSDSEDIGYLSGIERLAEKQGTEIVFIDENTDVRIGSLELTVYAPIGSGDINEQGLIILGDYGDFEFLVTGDAGTATENNLAAAYELPDIELLIVGHHGSRYSTGIRLLEDTTPDTAFISVGYNEYGHPTQEVLDRLDSCGIQVYRTDLNGNITMRVGEEIGKEN